MSSYETWIDYVNQKWIVKFGDDVYEVTPFGSNKIVEVNMPPSFTTTVSAADFAASAQKAMEQMAMKQKAAQLPGPSATYNYKGHTDIPPAEGVTPAEAARAVRSLLKSWVKNSFGQTNAAKENMTKKHRQNWKNVQTNQGKLNQLFVDLQTAAKTRKTSLINEKITEIVGVTNSIYAGAYGLYNGGSWLGAHAANIPVEQVTNAYSLIQVIPTVEGATTERSATTIRAITAILKVYYGLDVDVTMEQMPEAITPLLKAISATGDAAEKPTQKTAGQFDEEVDDYYPEDHISED